jgi:hypothetical protein
MPRRRAVVLPKAGSERVACCSALVGVRSHTSLRMLMAAYAYGTESWGAFIKRTAAADLLLPAKLNILLILLKSDFERSWLRSQESDQQPAAAIGHARERISAAADLLLPAKLNILLILLEI